MPDKAYWNDKIERIYAKYGFQNGYKLVFGPWSTLTGLDTAFLTPFPGLSVPGNIVDWEQTSDERGNSYEVERKWANTSLNDQFMRLIELPEIDRCAKKILTGVVCPFRTKDWKSLSKNQKRESRKFGIEFWEKPLRQPSLKLIIVSGNHAFSIVKKIVKINSEPVCIPAGWGEYELRRYELSNGPTIVHIPYLGYFCLLDNDLRKERLRQIFRGILD